MEGGVAHLDHLLKEHIGLEFVFGRWQTAPRHDALCSDILETSPDALRAKRVLARKLDGRCEYASGFIPQL